MINFIIVILHSSSMVVCPTCGWRMVKEQEFEQGGFVIGKYHCEMECPTQVEVSSPIGWMVDSGRWDEKS